MKKKEEAKYLDTEWNDMTTHLKGFLETGDQEELHSFRVQIKKLKALLSLVEDTSKQRGLINDFKPVKKIFRFAGHIRDAHTNLKLSEKYGLKNEAFENGQHKIIDDGTNEFQRKGKKYLKQIKQSHKHIRKHLPHVKNGSVANYYEKQLEQISINLTIFTLGEEMHTNRKLIKILIYNHKLADKALKDSLPLNTEYLDQLQSTIGKWHDNIIAEELFASPEINVKQFASRIRKKNTGVKRSLKFLADDFLVKAKTIETAVH